MKATVSERAASISVGNLALRLREHAHAFPERTALAFEVGEAGGPWGQRTYRQIEEASDACAWGLEAAGVRRGTRTILMIRPGPDLFTVLLALFKIGAVPVVVDPGMGIGRMLQCYRNVGAEAFVGVPIAHGVRVLARRTFASVRVAVTAGRRWFWGGTTLAASSTAGATLGPYPIASVSTDDPLMINFTTGSTGPAKAVECTHGMAAAMVQGVDDILRVGPGGIGLVTLPLLGVVDLLLGYTSVLAPMDVTRPASVEPRRLLEAAKAFAVTHMFGSPALLRRVAEHCVAEGSRLPASLRTVASGGAPVTVSIVEGVRAVLAEGARLETTYGATEALPIASIGSDEIVGETAARTASGAGTCVGRPTGGTEVRVIGITDTPIPSFAEAVPVPNGEVGEIAIAGPVVSPRYPCDPAADALHKMADGARRWHRTGDLGALDERGRLWFAGRKSQRVVTAEGTRFTVQVEGVFNAHPEVRRAALVGVPTSGAEGAATEAVVCVELRRPAEAAARARIAGELQALAAREGVTRGLTRFLFHPSFPVDIRHNAKIDREALAAWAARRLGRQRWDHRLWLRLIPVGGWLLLLFGLIWPFEHPAWRAIWWIDAFLSIVVHGAQLLPAMPRGRQAGYSRRETVLYTFLFGATWWKTMPGPRRSR